MSPNEFKKKFAVVITATTIGATALINCGGQQESGVPQRTESINPNESVNSTKATDVIGNIKDQSGKQYTTEDVLEGIINGSLDVPREQEIKFLNILSELNRDNLSPEAVRIFFSLTRRKKYVDSCDIITLSEALYDLYKKGELITSNNENMATEPNMPDSIEFSME